MKKIMALLMALLMAMSAPMALATNTTVMAPGPVLMEMNMVSSVSLNADMFIQMMGMDASNAEVEILRKMFAVMEQTAVEVTTQSDCMRMAVLLNGQEVMDLTLTVGDQFILSSSLLPTYNLDLTTVIGEAVVEQTVIGDTTYEYLRTYTLTIGDVAAIVMDFLKLFEQDEAVLSVVALMDEDSGIPPLNNMLSAFASTRGTEHDVTLFDLAVHYTTGAEKCYMIGNMMTPDCEAHFEAQIVSEEVKMFYIAQEEAPEDGDWSAIAPEEAMCYLMFTANNEGMTTTQYLSGMQVEFNEVKNTSTGETTITSSVFVTGVDTPIMTYNTDFAVGAAASIAVDESKTLVDAAVLDEATQMAILSDFVYNGLVQMLAKMMSASPELMVFVLTAMGEANAPLNVE